MLFLARGNRQRRLGDNGLPAVVVAVFGELELVLVELPLVVVELLVTTAADPPDETEIFAVTVPHGALLELVCADGTISFETTKPLAAAGSATALE